MKEFFAMLMVMVSVFPIAAFAETAAPTVDLTPLLQALLALLAALVTGKLIPWINSRTTERQQANLTVLANTFVYAAEQVFGANKGAEKLAYVRAGLQAKGYDVDDKAVLAAIEAAVKQMQDWTPTHTLQTLMEAAETADTAQDGAK